MKEVRPGLQTDEGKATPGIPDGSTVAELASFFLPSFSTQTIFVLVTR